MTYQPAQPDAEMTARENIRIGTLYHGLAVHFEPYEFADAAHFHVVIDSGNHLVLVGDGQLPRFRIFADERCGGVRGVAESDEVVLFV